MELKYYRLEPNARLKVKETLTRYLRDLEEVKFAYLYGSFNGEEPFRDIDIGVYTPGKDKTEAELYSLKLSGWLSDLVKFPVDARVLNGAPIPFLGQAIRGELLFEKDNDMWCDFAVWVTMRYLDMKPWLHHAIKEAHGS